MSVMKLLELTCSNYTNRACHYSLENLGLLEIYNFKYLIIILFYIFLCTLRRCSDLEFELYRVNNRFHEPQLRQKPGSCFYPFLPHNPPNNQS